jgi:hypothetical protein
VSHRFSGSWSSNLKELLRVWPTRFVRQHGPLRPVVERVLREFLKCGLLEHGFARLWCSEWRRSVLVAFSCRGRSFCPVVLTIPRLLRPLFRRRRDLLTELGRVAAEAAAELVRRAAQSDVRPGLKVEHRSGYYAPRDFGHARREDREHQLEDQLLSDLSARDFPVWLQTSYFRLAADRYYVPLSIALPGSAVPFMHKGGEGRASIDLIGVVRDEVDRPVARLRDTVTVAAPGAQEVRRKNVQYQTGFVLPPGRYRIKVVVRENQEGAFGSFEAEVRVPDLRAAKVRLSSVVMGTQLRPDAHPDARNPLSREGSELLPNVTHVVSAGQTLFFYYEVYDPGRTPRGGVRLQTTVSFFRGGIRRYESPAVELTRVAAADRHAAIFQLAVPPHSLDPGLYLCQVNVIDDVAGTFDFPRLALMVR